MERLAVLSLVLFVLIAIVHCEPWSWGDESQERSPASTQNRAARSASDNDRPKAPCASERSACQNLNSKIVTEVSAQIKEEFRASYIYLAMSNYFNRDDVSLRGFAKFFREASHEEREHGMKLMDYITKRGATATLFDIPVPPKTEWTSAEEAVNDALALERLFNDKLLNIHWTAQQVNDPHLVDYLETEFLTEQVDAIKQLSDFSTILKRVKQTPLGTHIFDEELYEGKRS